MRPVVALLRERVNPQVFDFAGCIPRSQKSCEEKAKSKTAAAPTSPCVDSRLQEKEIR